MDDGMQSAEGAPVTRVTFDLDGVEIEVDGIRLFAAGTVGHSPDGEEPPLVGDVATRQGRLALCERLVGCMGRTVTEVGRGQTGEELQLTLSTGATVCLFPPYEQQE